MPEVKSRLSRKFIENYIEWDHRGHTKMTTRVVSVGKSRKEAEIRASAEVRNMRANIRHVQRNARGTKKSDGSTPMDTDDSPRLDGPEGSRENRRQAGDLSERADIDKEDGASTKADVNTILGVRSPENRSFTCEQTRVQLQNEQVTAVPGAPAVGASPANAAETAAAAPVAGHANAVVAVAALADDAVAPRPGSGPEGALRVRPRGWGAPA
ncbi:hypothetical protein DFH11DRAFT_414086 [Phellopilus nigrolimitatus]|nr:hypothetical protein DFH11DRAFT_414086 [Phellopilus nigrolimitatus]